jgi:hypothetical protein
VLEATADGGALASVGVVDDHADGAVGELAQHVARAVAAAVVDDDDLEVDRQIDHPHAPHDLGHRVALVEHGHDHRQLAVLLGLLR